MQKKVVDWLCNLQSRRGIFKKEEHSLYEYAYRLLLSRILPLPHNFILGHPGFLGTFSRGGTLLLSQYPDINEGLELIERYKATFLSMVPSMAKLMLEILKEDEYDISSLRVLQMSHLLV